MKSCDDAFNDVSHFHHLFKSDLLAYFSLRSCLRHVGSLRGSIISIFITIAWDCLATSCISLTNTTANLIAVKTNAQSIAYCALAFGSGSSSNRVSIAAACKFLEKYDKIAECESMEMTYIFMIRRQNEDADVLFKDMFTQINISLFRRYLKGIINDCSYEYLHFVDQDIWMDLRVNKQMVEGIYKKEFDRVLPEMSDSEALVYAIFMAQYRLRMNELLIDIMMKRL